ncbi:MAG: leucine-rich repeat domain-containing protein [Bacteroidetes bacterium]|nr:MAG: leucine-rich repeat domain-containing protein [Bacteroidota bacterium]
MLRIILLSSLLFCFALSSQAQTDSTRTGGMASNPELTPQAGPVLGAEELARQPWFYSIDEAMRQPEQVYKLSLEDRKLKRFPREITRFPNLQVLNLSNNKLKDLPPYIAELPNLQILILHHNKLRSLPEEMKQLKHLEQLYLGWNKFMEVPAWVGGLSRLRRLDVAFNAMTLYEVDLLRARLPRCEVTH